MSGMLGDGETTEAKVASMLVKWKDRILREAASAIEMHFLNGPVEDFSEEEKGFERGLRPSVDEICTLMVDPTYFGRTPINRKGKGEQ